MLNMVMGWNNGWGKIWSWQALLMVCCHTELSMQMAEVSWVWYCVTFVVVGGNVWVWVRVGAFVCVREVEVESLVPGGPGAARGVSCPRFAISCQCAWGVERVVGISLR
jgi:hypothetical protein